MHNNYYSDAISDQQKMGTYVNFCN